MKKVKVIELPKAQIGRAHHNRYGRNPSRQVEPLYVDDESDPNYIAQRDSSIMADATKDMIMHLQNTPNANAWLNYSNNWYNKHGANSAFAKAFQRLTKLNKRKPTGRTFSTLLPGGGGFPQTAVQYQPPIRQVIVRPPVPKMIEPKLLPIPGIDIAPQLQNIPAIDFNSIYTGPKKQRVTINTPQGDKVRVQDLETKQFIGWEDPSGESLDFEEYTPIGNAAQDFPEMRRIKTPAFATGGIKKDPPLNTLPSWIGPGAQVQPYVLPTLEIRSTPNRPPYNDVTPYNSAPTPTVLMPGFNEDLAYQIAKNKLKLRQQLESGQLRNKDNPGIFEFIKNGRQGEEALKEMYRKYPDDKRLVAKEDRANKETGEFLIKQGFQQLIKAPRFLKRAYDIFSLPDQLEEWSQAEREAKKEYGNYTDELQNQVDTYEKAHGTYQPSFIERIFESPKMRRIDTPAFANGGDISIPDLRRVKITNLPKAQEGKTWKAPSPEESYTLAPLEIKAKSTDIPGLKIKREVQADPSLNSMYEYILSDPDVTVKLINYPYGTPGMPAGHIESVLNYTSPVNGNEMPYQGEISARTRINPWSYGNDTVNYDWVNRPGVRSVNLKLNQGQLAKWLKMANTKQDYDFLTNNCADGNCRGLGVDPASVSSFGITDPALLMDKVLADPNFVKSNVKGSRISMGQGIESLLDQTGNAVKDTVDDTWNYLFKKEGGSLSKAQVGIDWEGISNPELLRRAQEMGHNSIAEYRNSNWGYGKNIQAPPTRGSALGMGLDTQLPKPVSINSPKHIRTMPLALPAENRRSVPLETIFAPRKPEQSGVGKFLGNPNAKAAPLNFEEQVNEWLGKPMDKAYDAAERLSENGSDPVDNFRHPVAGMYTQQAIKDRVGIPILGDALGFLGANAMGIGHELGTIFRDERPWDVKLRESAEDELNNFAGSFIGLLPGTQEDKENIIYNLSGGNWLPDGVVWAPGQNMYFKDESGNFKRDTPYEMWNQITRKKEGGSMKRVKINGLPKNWKTK